MLIADKQKFLNDWRRVCAETDGCSSGLLKPLAEKIDKLIGRPRNYKCLCLQHDFDYRCGSSYGMTRAQADKELRSGVVASGHPVSAWVMWVGVRIGGGSSWRRHTP